MFRFSVFALILGIYPIVVTKGANILAIVGFTSPSHHIWNTILIDALEARGHNLTVLSAVMPKSAPKNAHYIHLEKLMTTLQNDADFVFNDFVEKGVFSQIPLLYSFMLLVCKGSLKSKGFEILRNYPDDFKFDLVIHDLTSGACLLGFLHKFKYPPLIGITAYKFTPEIVDMIGGHINPGYIPLISLPYNVNMTFFQRLENFALSVADHIYKDYIYVPQRDKLVAPYFGETLPPLRKIEQKMAVVLLNTHPSTDFPNPFPPNVIQVGGLQIPDPKPLPEDLENFVSNSTDGAILISFGTNVNSEMFGDDKQNMIIEAVKTFPSYNFLWKFEKDLSDGKVPNLLVKKWLPQSNILAHSKIKAFVSHGGGLSTQEAIWHGVPIVAVPFYLDQISNSKSAVLAGVAIKIDLQTITSQTIEDAIRTILEDRSYCDRMKLHSSRFKDRPMKPLDTAIWWIEYLLRDPNPTHLRSPVIDLGIWRSNSYDLIAYAFVLFVIVVWTICKVVTKVFRFFLVALKRKKDKLN